MKAYIESHFACRIISWAEPTEDGYTYSAVDACGRVVVADTVTLLILALDEAVRPLPAIIYGGPKLAWAA